MPKSLYRYHRTTEASLNNLRKKIACFSSPESFNDPFDCFWQVLKLINDEGRLSLEDFTEMSNAVLKRGGFEFLLNIDERWKRYKDLWSTFLNEARVYCLSASNRKHLMWAHYADGFRGFCIEFDGMDGFLKPAAKVQYEEAFPTERDMVELQLEIAYHNQITEDMLTPIVKTKVS